MARFLVPESWVNSLVKNIAAGVIPLKNPGSWVEAFIFSLSVAVLFLLGDSNCAAQAPTESMQLAGIAHAAIRVADLNKSRGFYKKLGFEEAFFMAPNEIVTQSFLKVNDLQFIELYPRKKPTDPIGFMHLCFESSEIAALNSSYATHGLAPLPVRRAGAGNLLFTMEGPEKQNIEYTQYMPGSRHSSDRSMHLGASRIAVKIAAMGIEMQEPTAAATFYRQRLGFKPARTVMPGQISLELPGASGQQIQFVQRGAGSAFQIYFAVPNLRQTAARLHALQITVKKQFSMLTIQDPDGNQIFFVKGK
jgi:catechol 2,3-dioxygenase-like lactoylglutathione lyase family enzyme